MISQHDNTHQFKNVYMNVELDSDTI